MAAINQDPEVTRFLNRPVDPEAIAAFYTLVTDHWAEHGFGFWALKTREPDIAGQVIGFAGVSHPTFPARVRRPTRTRMASRATRPATAIAAAYGFGL